LPDGHDVRNARLGARRHACLVDLSSLVAAA
jgi:hypothetical protein